MGGSTIAVHITSRTAQALGLTPKRAGKAAGQTAVVPVCFVAAGLPEPVAEYVFHPKRKWRFDFAWPIGSVGGIALEVDGGAWTQGRHTRGRGFIADQEKRNAAVLLGWRVFHCTPKDLKTGTAAALILEAMGR